MVPLFIYLVLVAYTLTVILPGNRTPGRGVIAALAWPIVVTVAAVQCIQEWPDTPGWQRHNEVGHGIVYGIGLACVFITALG